MEKKERLLSLDVFRGITIIGMILVNNPGSWANVYSPLLHAKWNGCTPTDLVFPFFLFIVGVTTTYSLSKYREDHSDKKSIIVKIAKRSIILFGLGLLLALIPNFDFASVRIPGVLQRIAVVYFFISLIFLNVQKKNIIKIVLLIVIAYWILLKTFSQFPIGYSSEESLNSLPAIIDRFLLSGHLYRNGVYGDPEGVLSTLPAIATGLIGILTGYLLKFNDDKIKNTIFMLVYGNLLMAAGYLMDFWFPINKHLWTSSYVIYTGGLALVTLAIIYWFVDVEKQKQWIKPFHIFGTNALFVFFFSSLTAKILYLIKITDVSGKSFSLKYIIYRDYFLPLLSPINASLLFALIYISIWLFIIWLLYRKDIFIKV